MTPAKKRLLSEQSAWKLLERRLSDSSAVTKFSSVEWDEANTLAHSLADLEESFDRYVNELLPSLLAADVAGPALEEALSDITEELRHVLYHLQDPKFFRHLVDTRDEDLERAPAHAGARRRVQDLAHLAREDVRAEGLLHEGGTERVVV